MATETEHDGSISTAAAIMGRKGGAAGTGKSKIRKTSFTSKTSKKALKLRWKK